MSRVKRQKKPIRRQRRVTRRMRHQHVQQSVPLELYPRPSMYQQGGGQRGLLESADAPPITNHTNIDFNARFQPTLKLREDGPTYTVYQTAHEPYPVWTAPAPPTMYTVVCWDPDVNPGKSFLHWLITNCKETDPSGGSVVASWTPPSPPPGSGEHRYILGLFKQEGPIQVPQIMDRTNFNATNFATTNKLSPIAYKGFRVLATPAPAPPPPPANANPPPVLPPPPPVLPPPPANANPPPPPPPPPPANVVPPPS